MTLTLDYAAKALGMPLERAMVTIEALRAAFETNGKEFSWNKTARIAARAAKKPASDDPDVIYAAEWLKSLKSAR